MPFLNFLATPTTPVVLLPVKRESPLPLVPKDSCSIPEKVLRKSSASRSRVRAAENRRSF